MIGVESSSTIPIRHIDILRVMKVIWKLNNMTPNKIMKLESSWGKQFPPYTSVTPYNSSFFISRLRKGEENFKLIQHFNSLTRNKTAVDRRIQKSKSRISVYPKTIASQSTLK